MAHSEVLLQDPLPITVEWPMISARKRLLNFPVFLQSTQNHSAREDREFNSGYLPSFHSDGVSLTPESGGPHDRQALRQAGNTNNHCTLEAQLRSMGSFGFDFPARSKRLRPRETLTMRQGDSSFSDQLLTLQILKASSEKSANTLTGTLGYKHPCITPSPMKNTPEQLIPMRQYCFYSFLILEKKLNLPFWGQELFCAPLLSQVMKYQ